MTTHLTDTQKQTIRIALLEFAGFKVEYHPQGHPMLYNLPDYTASLDACHAIEVKLTDTQWGDFYVALWRIHAKESPTDNKRKLVSASAEHRALALYRALNLGELGD